MHYNWRKMLQPHTEIFCRTVRNKLVKFLTDSTRRLLEFIENSERRSAIIWQIITKEYPTDAHVINGWRRSDVIRTCLIKRFKAASLPIWWMAKKCCRLRSQPKRSAVLPPSRPTNLTSAEWLIIGSENSQSQQGNYILTGRKVFQASRL